jgi:putative transposase
LEAGGGDARSQGWRVNNKRIQRLWRSEGLKVPYRKRKKPLRGHGLVMGAMCPIRPNVLWALDFQFNQTSNGRTLKLLNVIDEFTRECPAIVVARNIDADGVVACLERIAAERGAPMYLRFDIQDDSALGSTVCSAGGGKLQGTGARSASLLTDRSV